MKLALLSPTNLDFLAAELNSLHFETYTAPYGQVVVEAINPDSGLYAFAPDIVILHYDAADVMRNKLIRPFEASMGNEWNAIDEIKTTVSTIASTSPNTSIVLNTIPLPATHGMGRLDQNTPAGLRTIQNTHNSAISSLANELPQVIIHDYQSLAESHGLNNWYDARMWYLARARLARNSTSAVANDLAALLATAESPRAKVIVIDLDNTCWGGVIGDDGIEGITLGTDGPGLAFSTFQQALLNFRDQGVLLAVASKNDFDVVRTVFDSHPEMILKYDDISSWQVNWDDKAVSIQRISEELDLDPDSFVFFDDNPVERLRVSEAYPEVTVVDVPNDPSNYVDVLFNCEALTTVRLTDEDLVRPERYKARSKRTGSSKTFTDVGQFLESLDMKVEISENLTITLPRIAQLTQKTNQFNLRTQRYSEADLTNMIANGSHRVFWLRLSDKFGDEGIVAVAIVRTGSQWFIDTLLMSCRILNRGIERALIRHLKQEAHIVGVKILIGEFIPSGRNEIVRDLYSSMDFSEQDGKWIVDTASNGPEGLTELSVMTSGRKT